MLATKPYRESATEVIVRLWLTQVLEAYLGQFWKWVLIISDVLPFLALQPVPKWASHGTPYPVSETLFPVRVSKCA